MDWYVLSCLPKALVAVLGAGGDSEARTANHQKERQRPCIRRRHSSLLA